MIKKSILRMLYLTFVLQAFMLNISKANIHYSISSAEKDTLPQDKFLIGIFYGPPWKFTNDKQYQAIKEAHVDYIQFIPGVHTEEKNIKILNLAGKHGLGVYVYDSRVHGSDADLKAMVYAYKNYPATIGYFIQDEPNVKGLDWAAATYRKILSLDPQRIPHVNLLPGFVIPGYEKNYIEPWIKKVGKENLVYLSFDNYPFMIDGSIRKTYYQNLDIIRRAALENHVKTSCYLQSVGIKGVYRRPDENELRFSAYSTIAYGIKNIVWFTYWIPTHQPGETFTNAIIDSLGNKTDLYRPFKDINGKLKHLGRVLIHLNAMEVYHTGKPIFPGVKELPADFFWQPMDKADKMIISHFVDITNGKDYIMVVNESLQAKKRFSFKLRGSFKSIFQISKVSNALLKTNYNSKNSVLSDTFFPGEGKLYELDRM